MNDWAMLVDALIGGTQEHSAPDVEYTGLSAESVLLKRLALADVAQRAGTLATNAKARPPTEPRPPETRPPCSQATVALLTPFTQSPFFEPLALEWFYIIGQRGKRVPHNHLPFVMGLTNPHPDWTPFVTSVIGERGRWIAHQSDTYPHLKQAELWAALPDDQHPPLVIPPLQANLPYLTDMRNQLLEGLKHE